MDRFPIDLLQYKVFDKLDFALQIRFRQVCKWFFRLEIHDFLNIEGKYLEKLTDEILFHYPFIKYLDATNNSKIANVNHLTKLQVLNASRNCGISDNGIKYLNLIELKAYNNHKITDINHLTQLQKLDASFDCGIDDDGIKYVNLVELDACFNPKIIDVNHLTKLEKLNASGYCCGIGNNGTKYINLVELNICHNPKITDINHLTKLKILNASGYNCGQRLVRYAL